MFFEQLTAIVALWHPFGCKLSSQHFVRAIAECFCIVADYIVGIDQRWIPVITGKDLVGTLTGLHNLDMLGNFLRQQIKADIIIGNHWLRHGSNGAGQRIHQIGRWYENLVMVGAEMLGDQVRIDEFIAFFAVGLFKAD